MTRTITLASGQQITLRVPTEAEAIRLSDQRATAAIPGDRLVDKTDDGDEEVLACIVTPDQATVIELLEEYPRLPRRLEQCLREMGGEDLPVIEQPERVTAELRAEHGRLLALAVVPRDWSPKKPSTPLAQLLVRKFSRIEMKLLEQNAETRRRNRPSYAQLAAAAKVHAVDVDPGLWELYPFLSMQLGLLLWQAASVRAVVTEGK